MNGKLFIVFSVFLIFLMGCTVQQKTALHSNTELRFRGEYTIPLKQQFKKTTIGGLSGIDYDAKNDIYYLISDDGSKIDPARFYAAKIKLGDKTIDTVEFLNVTTLLDPNDSIYPYSSIDPEAVRYHPLKQQLFWSSEGEKTTGKQGTILFDPSINISALNGKWKGRFMLPANMHMQNADKGPRTNGSFEGLSFTPDFKTLYVSLEEPIFEDGPRAGTGDSAAWIRILTFDAKTRKPLAQYAYRVDPVAYPPVPAGSFRINGVSEILCVDKDRLLVMERSFSTGRKGCVLKLYLADLSHATDVSSIASLKDEHDGRPVSKKLLLNMESIGPSIYNVEGITFGPKLPNGHQSLIMVADDNFSPLDKTQFLLFEID
jgi:hypothetical protein